MFKFDGVKLKKYRLKQDLKVKKIVSDLEKMTGEKCTRHSFWCWENNKVQPRASFIFAISDLFGVPYDYFLEKKTKAKKKTA